MKKIMWSIVTRSCAHTVARCVLLRKFMKDCILERNLLNVHIVINVLPTQQPFLLTKEHTLDRNLSSVNIVRKALLHVSVVLFIIEYILGKGLISAHVVTSALCHPLTYESIPLCTLG